MRKEKPLISLLRSVVDLLSEETARNPEFATKIEAMFAGLPDVKRARKAGPDRQLPEPPPDIHAEWAARGEAEFRLWLRDQPVSVLREVIRREDLDPTRRSTKWKEPEKLANFIANGLSARSSRGSSFIGRGLGD